MQLHRSFRFSKPLFSKLRLSLRPSKVGFSRVRLLNVIAPLVLLSLVASSCMEDPITEPEVKSRVVFRPSQATPPFRATNYNAGLNTGDLRIFWSPSPSDTQINFKGYFIKLYHSFNDTLEGHSDSLAEFVANGSTTKVDTSFTFTNLPIGRYTALIWGQRFTDTLTTDSLVLSKDSLQSSFDFDPRPVDDPKNLRMLAMSPTRVRILFDRPQSINNIGFAGIHVYRRVYPDIRTSDSNRLASISGKVSVVDIRADSLPFVDVDLPANTTTTGQNAPKEKAFYLFVKSVRNDDVESPDSAQLVRWAGAEQLPRDFRNGIDSNSERGRDVGPNILIGNINQQWDIGDNANANLHVDREGDDIILTALDGGLFRSQYDRSTTLSKFGYTTPFDESEFTEQQIRIPAAETSDGVIVYARLKVMGELMYTRILVNRYVKDTIRSWFTTQGKINIRASLQPAKDDGGTQMKYF